MWKQITVVMVIAVLTTAGASWADEPSAEALHDDAEQRAEQPQAQAAAPAENSDAPVELGDFWLGVECYPAPPPLADQLGLSEHGGLVVEQVLPGSPAEHAGLRRHDVIVRAGDAAVAQIPDLARAVSEAGEKELKLEVIRSGERRELTATPARRPPEEQPQTWTEPPGEDDLERLWTWFGRVGPNEEWRRPFRLHFFQPGAILPPGAKMHPPLPADMRVTIRKEGNEPAQVTVERGEDVWEVSEHDLAELPDDVRPHVERMLGRMPVAGLEGFRVLPRRPGPLDEPPPRPEPPAARRPPGRDAERLQRHLENQMDEMNRRLEEMRRSLDRLRE